MPRRRSQNQRTVHLAQKKRHRDMAINKDGLRSARGASIDQEGFDLAREELQFEDGIGDVDVDDEDEELFPLKNADTPQFGELSDTSLEPESSAEKPKPEVLKQGERIQFTTSIDSESDEDELKWGPKKSAYYVNRDDLEDDESQELNLQETMRLQSKARSVLFEEDFGLDDYHSAPSEDCCQSSIGLIPSENLQNNGQTFPSAESWFRSLEREHPEFLALSRDWAVASNEFEQVERKLFRPDAGHPFDTDQGLTYLYHQTLQCYLTLLAFYLHLSSNGASLKSLRTHPIMERLLILRESSQELNLLGLVDIANSDPESELSSQYSISESMLTRSFGSPAATCSAGSSSLESDSTNDVVEDGVIDNSFMPNLRVLDEPTFSGRSQTSQRLGRLDVKASHFGDPILMERFDVENKRTRKKTLRFHVAKIDGARPQRDLARHNRGGDDDLACQPADSRNRTFKIAQNKRQREQSPGEENESGHGEDYYDAVKREKKRVKAEKKTNYETETLQRAERDGSEKTNENNEGPRSLTRAILTNKGLTPQRTKTVRNPRVKKRLRYEKAKQKLSSQKQIYRGGPVGGKYSGEMSGINSRTVKSARF